MAVSATYTKDIHYSGIITVDGETVVSMDANMDAKHPTVHFNCQCVFSFL